MSANVISLPVDQVVFRKDLYPRFTPDAATIQRYQDSIESLPPIEVNQHNELIDGYHRWNAHREAGLAVVPAKVTTTESDDQLLDFAIDRNASHGIQLRGDEKKAMARRLYTSRQRTEAELARLLSVSERVVRTWLADVKKSEREQQKKQAFDLWLACHTQEEIANHIGSDQRRVSELVEKLPDLEEFPNPVKVSAQYQDSDWSPPLYNVWTWSKDDDNSVDHFGNSHSGIVDRLVYLYTDPFEIVVDPFGGGGSTVDVCRKRMRRYWCADRKVKAGLAEQKLIRQADIAQGPPRLQWSDVALVYLDPPYWKQAENQYSNDPDDLANMDIDRFYEVITNYVRETAAKMRPGSHIALLIQPTQWKNEPTRHVVDHIVDLCKRLDGKKLRLDQRISCPYGTQQANPQQVTWARDNKRLLVLSRECIVWEVQ